MILNKKFEYPDVEQVTLESGFRYYVCPETSAHMASVTTILDATADKTALLEWKERVGEARAKRESEFATDLGSLMHTHVECFIEGLPRPTAFTPPRKTAKEMADLIIENGLPFVDEVWGIETRLFVPGLFAGTTDLVGVYKGKPAVIDHKSSKKPKPRAQIVDYRDQLAAYIIAHNERYGTDIQTGVIFMGCRNGEFKAYEFDEEEIRIGRKSFIDRVELYYAKCA